VGKAGEKAPELMEKREGQAREAAIKKATINLKVTPRGVAVWETNDCTEELKKSVSAHIKGTDSGENERS